MQWPPDYKKEVERRLNLHNKLKSNPVLMAGSMAHYKNNPIDWINDWCVTYDPRAKSPKPKLMPFVLFKRQKEFVLFLKYCYDNGQSGLIEKARDMGASWICCAFSVWLWLFHDGSAVGWGSRKEEYVDKRGDPKAIFPKIRQLIENLPSFMIPKDYKDAVHAPYMKILNPSNGSSITGEAGDNIGRGGRTSIYFKDESAHYERPDLIEAALGDNTDVQVDISSVNGTNNVFYRRRMAGELWEEGKIIPKDKTAIFIMDWRDHPAKSQLWYDNRRSRAEAEGLLHMFAQEVDRDYASAVDRVIIPAEWVRSAIDAHIKLGIQTDGECVAGQDVADDGGDKNALAIRKGVVLQLANDWGGEADAAASIALPLCKDYHVSQLYYDSIGVGAGFKGGINALRDRGAIPNYMVIQEWRAGDPVIDPDGHIISGDPDSPTNADQYENLKAQAWFRIRSRFQKTHLAITKDQVFPHDELISIPSDMKNAHNLIMQLSQAVHKYSMKGKTMVDKKPEGAFSPNLADAVVMCYCPTRRVTSFDIV